MNRSTTLLTIFSLLYCIVGCTYSSHQREILLEAELPAHINASEISLGEYSTIMNLNAEELGLIVDLALSSQQGQVEFNQTVSFQSRADLVFHWAPPHSSNLLRRLQELSVSTERNVLLGEAAKIVANMYDLLETERRSFLFSAGSVIIVLKRMLISIISENQWDSYEINDSTSCTDLLLLSGSSLVGPVQNAGVNGFTAVTEAEFDEALAESMLYFNEYLQSCLDEEEF